MKRTPLTRRTKLQPGAEARKRAALTGSTIRQRSKRPTRTLIDRLDGEWKRAVRGHYGEYCVLCGRPSKICHHAWPKGTHSTRRHDEANGFVLCYRHHMWTHNAPERLRAFQWVADERVRRHDLLTLDEVRAMLAEAGLTVWGEESRRRHTQTELG